MKRRERRAEQARMAAYLAALVPLFRLEVWDIVVGDGPPEDPRSRASVTYHRTLHDAVIRFADSFYACDRAEQRQTVAHELLHLVTAMENMAAITGLEDLEAPARALARFDHEYERATDHLSRILAPALPLPPPRDAAEEAEDAAAARAGAAAAASAADDPAVRAALAAYDAARVAYNADLAAGRGPGRYESVVAAQGPLWAALDAHNARQEAP